MGIDYSQLPHGKGVPGYVSRKQRQQAAKAALESCYAQVDARDHGICRVTGVQTQPGAVAPERRREHHHLRPRSLEKGLVDDPENVVTVSALAHQLITDGWLIAEGTRASGVIRWHWKPETPESMKVIRIQSRRWSQNHE